MSSHNNKEKAKRLRAARELITNPEHWTTGVLSRDEAGGFVTPRSPHAVCWCVLGACQKVGVPGALITIAQTLLPECFSAITEVSLINDNDGHQAVLDLLDAAIARLEK